MSQLYLDCQIVFEKPWSLVCGGTRRGLLEDDGTNELVPKWVVESLYRIV